MHEIEDRFLEQSIHPRSCHARRQFKVRAIAFADIRLNSIGRRGRDKFSERRIPLPGGHDVCARARTWKGGVYIAYRDSMGTRDLPKKSHESDQKRHHIRCPLQARKVERSLRCRTSLWTGGLISAPKNRIRRRPKHDLGREETPCFTFSRPSYFPSV